MAEMAGARRADERARVDEVAARYFHALESGVEPRLEEYFAELAPSEHDEFCRLVDAVARVRDRLPRFVGSGTRLAGRYRLEEQLGSGGSGKVYAALDETLERRVAIKVLHPQDAGDPDARRRFARESRLLAALRHPGIVVVHEVGRDGEVDFIVMDLVEGTPASRLIEGTRANSTELTPVSREAAVDILIAVCAAVEAAHSRGIVHRDITPANVIVTPSGAPVLLDFGLGGMMDGRVSRVTRGLFGTYSYLAPEQVRGGRTGADVRTDVYQLGLLLYEMLLGQPAFPPGPVGDVLDRIARGRYPAPLSVQPELSPGLVAVLRRALATDPERRYATVSEMREDLARHQRGESPLACRGARLADRFARGRGELADVVGVAILVVFVVGGVVWLRSPSWFEGVAASVETHWTDKRSPFDSVQWRGTTPDVSVDGEWYELLAIDGLDVGEIVDGCRELYGERVFHGRPLWIKRFEEDLVVAVAALFSHEIVSTVTLELRRLTDDRVVILEDVPVTHGKRQGLRDAAVSRL